MSSVTTDSSSVSRSNSKAPRNLTNWQRSVEKAYRDGDLPCGNFDHAMRGPGKVCPDGKTRPFPVTRPAAQILEMMEPFKKARCHCEREACRQMWPRLHPGQWQQEFVCPGSFFKGVGEYNPKMPGKKVMPTPYRLNKEQEAELHQRFPDWLFVQTSSHGHDHPVSHCTNLIAGYETVKGLPSGSRAQPKRYLDLHGNPKSNARFSGDTKIIDTVVSLESPKDYVRQATKWGPEFTGNRRNYFVSALRDLPRDRADYLATVDGLLSQHTLYYYDRSEIAALLAATKGKTLEATIHRHKGPDGKLNLGELSWVKESRGSRWDVKQTNTHTGESYVHPCTEEWFEDTFWSPHGDDMEAALTAGDKLDSLAWTINQTCEGTYKIIIVAVPARVAAINNVGAFDKQTTTAPLNSAASIEKNGEVVFKLGKQHRMVKIRPEHQPLFDMCRKRMVNKPRDASGFSSHVNFVTIKSNGVAKTVSVDVHQMRDIALASFWCDFEVDLANTTRPNFFAAALMQEHNRLLSGTSFQDYGKVKDVVIDALLVCLHAKNTKEVFVRGLQLAKSTI
jgi:hypothetical protein